MIYKMEVCILSLWESVTLCYSYYPTTVPPSLSGGPDNLVVKAADTVSFCHQVQGTPTPSIQWEHNNKQLLHSARVKITNDGVNVSMTILDAGRLDEGVYTCTALNSLGSMSAQTKLVILGKFNVISIYEIMEILITVQQAKI